MQYAILGNQRREATPDQFAECPGCQSRVRAKCGPQRVWHWAHLGKVKCNFEREVETDWHRNWKNQFPAEWREVIRRAQSGERHIADVLTTQGVAIEFQRSPLHPKERVSRELFHRNMAWVVDGARPNRRWSKFLQGQRGWKSTPWKGVYTISFPEECFPIEWLACTVPVFFDFEGVVEAENNAPSPSRKSLWALLPGRAEGRAVILEASRQGFINVVQRRQQIIDTQKILQQVTDYLNLLRLHEVAAYNHQRRLNYRHPTRIWRRRLPRF